MYEWDEAKRSGNLAKHGVDFVDAARLNWKSAVTVEDIRHEYGERRLHSTGLIGTRLHVLIWTPRETGPRLISLRRASEREEKRWENERP
ncbi:MAG: BrnT family toxin [Paracoccaceae bacterium]